MNNKLKTIEELIVISKDLHKKGKLIVSTNGCFDILHTGHIFLLEKAKSYGDILIVFLDSDNSIKRLKGEDRPINSEEDRIKLLSALHMVDYICVFDEDKPYHFLEKIKTDFYVTGKDSKPKIEEFISIWGGKYINIGNYKGKSTSLIINKVNEIDNC